MLQATLPMPTAESWRTKETGNQLHATTYDRQPRWLLAGEVSNGFDIYF